MGRIGIVGSRSFPQLELIQEYFRSFQRDDVIVSGCAQQPIHDHNKNNTVDIEARRLAGEFRLKYKGYPPNLKDVKKGDPYWKYVNKYFARNTQIANDLAKHKESKLLAFVNKDKGGSWDTIRKCRKKGVRVEIIRPSNVPIEEFSNPKPRPGRPAKSIYHLKQVNFGSIALHLHRHFSVTEWEAYVEMKDTQPRDCAAYMQPDFLNFFDEYGSSLGHIDAITQAPRSLRHIDKAHCMDYLCQSIAHHIGIPYVEMFAPWDKKRRGIREHPELKALPVVEQYAGKIVYVLDDVSNTGTTLKRCVNSLHAAGAHAHGICFVRWA